jgi:DNA-binding transcriptional LysR family regulator
MLEYLRSFAYIEAIETNGSIRKAARALYITPSALDRRLQELEAELGVTLFERHARGMRVTQAGEIFLHHVRAHRADSERMRSELDRLNGLHQGVIRIAASQATTNFLLPKAIREFQALHPGVGFHVRVSTHAALLDLLRRFEADIAIVYGLPHNEDLVTRLEIPQTLYALMRIGHPLASHARPGMKECMAFPLALPDIRLGLRSWVNAEIACHPCRPEIALESDSLEMLRRYVAATDAITFQITAGVRGYGEADGIAVRPLERSATAPGVLAVVRLRDRVLPAPADAFVDTLQGMLHAAADPPEQRLAFSEHSG